MTWRRVWSGVSAVRRERAGRRWLAAPSVPGDHSSQPTPLMRSQCSPYSVNSISEIDRRQLGRGRGGGVHPWDGATSRGRPTGHRAVPHSVISPHRAGQFSRRYQINDRKPSHPTPLPPSLRPPSLSPSSSQPLDPLHCAEFCRLLFAGMCLFACCRLSCTVCLLFARCQRRGRGWGGGSIGQLVQGAESAERWGDFTWFVYACVFCNDVVNVYFTILLSFLIT